MIQFCYIDMDFKTRFYAFLLCMVAMPLMACNWNAVVNADGNQAALGDSSNKDTMTYKIQKTEEQWRLELGDEAYRILRLKGTEKPFSSEFETQYLPGTYVCKGCGSELFSSETKFDAGCGWPSFYKGIDPSKIKEISDNTYGMRRVEVVCSACGGHLGHVFTDGFGQPTGLRYCINGMSLGFQRKTAEK